MPKINNPRDHIVDEFEIGKILNAVQDDKPLLFAVAMAYLTGARISEILMLRAKDFTDDGIFWSVSVPTLKQRMKIHGREPRRLLIIKKEKIYEMVIRPHLDRQVDLTRPLLFPNSRTALADRLRTRYPDVYFHWFRHTRATLWSRNVKGDIFKLRYIMGWQDIRMANRYVHNQNMAQSLRGDL